MVAYADAIKTLQYAERLNRLQRLPDTALPIPPADERFFNDIADKRAVECEWIERKEEEKEERK